MNTPDKRTAIWEQINANRAKTQQSSSPSPEDRKRTLKARAQTLAHRTEPPIDPRDLLEIVEFELAGERYGIELTQVRELCFLKELTPVPCAPAFVLGIINLRGEIHTVIDLKSFFDLPDAGLTELNQVLILKSDDLRLGILADAIHGVRTIPLAALTTSLSTLSGLRASYLKGVTSERLIVIDAAKILSNEAILVREEVR